MGREDILKALNEITQSVIFTELALQAAKQLNDEVAIKVFEHQSNQIREDVEFFQGLLTEINRNKNIN